MELFGFGKREKALDETPKEPEARLPASSYSPAREIALIQKDLETLKAMLSTLREMKKDDQDKFARIGEQIGELRSSLLNKEKEVKELEVDEKTRRKRTALQILAKARPHNLYLVDDEKIESSLLAMYAFAKKGYRAMMISRTKPELLNKSYNLANVELHWLTTEGGRGTISPTSTEEIFNSITEFMSRNAKGIIVLDGLLTIIDNVDFKNVVTLVQYLKDKVAEKETIIIIPVSARAMKEAELERLKHDIGIISWRGK